MRSSTSWSRKSVSSRVILPDSILEKSRMSLMMPSSDSEAACTLEIRLRCSGSSCVSSASLDMPTIAFIGVRISWLMLAKKMDLAAVAASAASLALRSSCALRSSSLIRFWSVTSSRTSSFAGTPSCVTMGAATTSKTLSCQRSS